jgi:hypothetical protein
MGVILKKEEKDSSLISINDGAALLSLIGRAASDPSVDMDKMERLMAMHERMTAKQAENQFNDAMCSAQSETRQVATDANNPQTRSRYATYAALDASLRPIYTRHGFSISYDTDASATEGCIRVLAYVSHRAGHTRTYHADMPADGKGAKGGDVMTKTHAFGAGTAYGMRYLLKMIFNVAVGEYDNDGNDSHADTVTEDQAATLQALIEEVKADKKAFLAYFGADSIQNIPSKHYKRAVDALNKKRAK